MKFNFPGGKALIDIPGPAVGREVTPDTTREGFVDDGLIAWPERVIEARRQWTQAMPKDFERLGKRLWRDRASGLEFRQADGCPLFGVGTDAVRFDNTLQYISGTVALQAWTARVVLELTPIRPGEAFNIDNENAAGAATVFEKTSPDESHVLNCFIRRLSLLQEVIVKMKGGAP